MLPELAGTDNMLNCQLDGEGIRYEISAFVRMIRYGQGDYTISRDISRGFARLMQQFYRGDYTVLA